MSLRPTSSSSCVGVRASAARRRRALCVAERAAVARVAVQAVVDALGDAEELRVALDDDPARVDARRRGRSR